MTPCTSPPVHLSTLETEHFQNDAFSNVSTLETVFELVSVFIGVFGRFSVDDRRQRIKTYAFSNENALLWIGPEISLAMFKTDTSFKFQKYLSSLMQIDCN